MRPPKLTVLGVATILITTLVATRAHGASPPLAMPSAARSPAATASWWPMEPGRRWVYAVTTAGKSQRDLVIEVVEILGRASPTPRFHVARRGGVGTVHDVYRHDAGRLIHDRQAQGDAMVPAQTFEGDRVILPAVMTPGVRWSWKGTGLLALPVAEESEIGTPETIAVPAGRFDSVPVRTKVTVGPIESYRTAWYVAGVGPVKLRVQTGEIASEMLLTSTRTGIGVPGSGRRDRRHKSRPEGRP